MYNLKFIIFLLCFLAPDPPIDLKQKGDSMGQKQIRKMKQKSVFNQQTEQKNGLLNEIVPDSSFSQQGYSNTLCSPPEKCVNNNNLNMGRKKRQGNFF